MMETSLQGPFLQVGIKCSLFTEQIIFGFPLYLIVSGKKPKKCSFNLALKFFGGWGTGQKWVCFEFLQGTLLSRLNIRLIYSGGMSYLFLNNLTKWNRLF